MAKAKATDQQELVVQRRVTAGTRVVRRLRHERLVPGIVYGKAMEPISISMERKALMNVLRTKAGEHALVRLTLDGAKPWEKPALVKEVQHDPVDGRVIHVDFHAIALTEQIRVKIPVILKGEAVGVKQESGILEQFLREIEVECLPTELPDGVEYDVSALKIGDAVHVRDLVPPRGAKVLTDPAGAVASVQQPKAEKVAEVAEAITEPEVIREKKEEAEPAAGEAKAEAAEPKKETKPEK